MKWRKRGLVYVPDGTVDWAAHSALQPTPIALDEDRIRVYLGFRDAEGISSVGYVDVDAQDPSRVVGVSAQPVLSRGERGAFDENGVVPCAVAHRGDRLFLYYAGYQLGVNVRFFVFGGLAVSLDGGDSFARHTTVPLLDRTEEGMFFRVAHSVIREDPIWRVWYGAGSRWQRGPGKELPVYDIRYMESEDGLEFPREGRVCIELGAGEYRVGRPYVVKDGPLYRMFFAAATVAADYRLAYAESEDGIEWARRDELLGLDVSPDGWDSEMISYPSVVSVGGRTYLFYNGNDYGRTGFGWAELEEW